METFKFENFRPQLNPCTFQGEGRNVVLEEIATKRHFILPVEARPVLECLDGQRTVQEIVTYLHETEPNFRFRTLVDTIDQLAKAGFLDRRQRNRAQAASTSIFDQMHSALNSLRWSRVLVSKIEFKTLRNPAAFFLISFLVIGGGILSLVDGNYFSVPNDLGIFHDSALLGAGLLFVYAAFLMTMKALLQALLQFFATGIAYSLSLRFSRCTVSLGISDAAVYLSRSKLVPAVFHMASLLSFLLITGVMGIWFGNSIWFPQAQALTLFLTLMELNPYLTSDFRKFFEIFNDEGTQKNLIPYLRNRSLLAVKSNKVPGQFKLALFAAYALAWSGCSLYFCLSVFEKSSPNLWLTAISTDSNWFSKLAAMVFLLGLAGFSIYFLFDLIATLALNLYYPFADQVSELRAKWGSRVVHQNLEEIKRTLASAPLLQGFSDSALTQLASKTQARSFSPGVKLIVQGTLNNEIHLLVDGQVMINKREETGAQSTIARLGPGTAFGEISALRGQSATADVVTEKTSMVLSIPKEALSTLAQSAGADHELLVQRIMLGHFLGSSPLFKPISQEAIQLFIQKGQMINLPAGKIITEQGSLDRTFYLIVHGEVEVLINNRAVKRMSQGEFFGEIALLADVARTATVRTTQESVLLRLDASGFWSILSQNIGLSLLIEEVAEVRARETRRLQEAS